MLLYDLPVGKKRAAWDVKGRLLDMEEAFSQHMKHNEDLQQQISGNNDRIWQLESLNRQLEGQTTVATEEIDSLHRQLRYGQDCRHLQHPTNNDSLLIKGYIYT